MQRSPVHGPAAERARRYRARKRGENVPKREPGRSGAVPASAMPRS